MVNKITKAMGFMLFGFFLVSGMKAADYLVKWENNQVVVKVERVCKYE